MSLNKSIPCNSKNHLGMYQLGVKHAKFSIQVSFQIRTRQDREIYAQVCTWFVICSTNTQKPVKHDDCYTFRTEPNTIDTTPEHLLLEHVV